MRKGWKKTQEMPGSNSEPPCHQPEPQTAQPQALSCWMAHFCIYLGHSSFWQRGRDILKNGLLADPPVIFREQDSDNGAQTTLS